MRFFGSHRLEIMKIIYVHVIFVFFDCLYFFICGFIIILLAISSFVFFNVLFLCFQVFLAFRQLLLQNWDFTWSNEKKKLETFSKFLLARQVWKLLVAWWPQVVAALYLATILMVVNTSFFSFNFHSVFVFHHLACDFQLCTSICSQFLLMFKISLLVFPVLPAFRLLLLRNWDFTWRNEK